MHSATKYLNGHSDAIVGALCFAHGDGLATRVADIRKLHGLILGPFEAFLLIRGLRTVDLRVRAAAANAFELAQRLSNAAAVAQVLYPGLPDHPGHAVAKRQMQGGFGGMLSIRVRGGRDAAIAAASRVKIWKRATSLGGVESSDRAPRLLRGPRVAVPARPAETLGGHRGCRGFVAGYRSGARRVGTETGLRRSPSRRSFPPATGDRMSRRSVFTRGRKCSKNRSRSRPPEGRFRGIA